jgi:hypothetical protein
MGLFYYMLESGDAIGTGAETDNRDLPRELTTKALLFNLEALANGTGGQTRLNLAAQLDQVRIGAVESNRISEIDGEDLDAFNVLNGNSAYLHTSTTDNQVITLGMTYALDPFVMGPYPDFNQSFGISGRVARKVEYAMAADGTGIDGKNLAIGLVGKDNQQTTGGYLTFLRATNTMANNTNFYADVPQPGQLLGIHFFETNETSSGQTAIRTANDIQQLSITLSRKDILGPVYPDMIKQTQGQYEMGSLSDEGFGFWNLGIRNEVGTLGRGPIPDKMEMKALGGSDAGAARFYVARLNSNV